MQDELSRAQHYRALAQQMRTAAQAETDAARQRELLEVAAQYENLADKLIGRRVSREAR